MSSSRDKLVGKDASPYNRPVKIYLSRLFLFGLLLGLAFPVQGRVRTQDFVTIVEGRVVEDNVMADSKGRVFIEFIKGTVVVNVPSQDKYEGSLLPPEIISPYDKPPRARMREVVSFELIGQTPGTLKFIDQIDLMHPRTRRRYEFLNRNSIQRYNAVNLYIPLTMDLYGVGLWQYNSNTEDWKRIGGKLEPTSQEDVQVFSAVLRGTGAYTLFNENPDPASVDPMNPDEIETVEKSPFPSVLPPEEELLEDPFGAEEEVINPDPRVIPSIDDADSEIPAPLQDHDQSLPLLRPDESDVFYEDESSPMLGSPNQVPPVQHSPPTSSSSQGSLQGYQNSTSNSRVAATAPVSPVMIPDTVLQTRKTYGRNLQASSFDLPNDGTDTSSQTKGLQASPVFVFLGTLIIVGVAVFWKRKEDVDDFGV